LPAISSVLSTWTTSFGFTKMTESERMQFLDFTFLNFPDTVMCQKLLIKNPSEESSPARGIFLTLKASYTKGSNSLNYYKYSVLQEPRVILPMKMAIVLIWMCSVLSLKYIKQNK
jgi:hypothetical protein